MAYKPIESYGVIGDMHTVALVGTDGSIDFEKQALFRPQDILPSQAVTLNDYRKLIFDSTPEIENVAYGLDFYRRFRPNADTGLYRKQPVT